LDFEKVPFISVYAPKCLCGLYLSASCYQIWHMSLSRCNVLNVAIGFLEFLIFTILSPVLDFEKVAFISVYAPECLCGLCLSTVCDQS